MTRTYLFLSLLVLCLAGLVPQRSLAHFGAVIPSAELVEQSGSHKVGLEFSFLHPMEWSFMELERPVRAGVMVRGEKIDLTDSLVPAKRGKGSLWRSEYTLKRPGDHIFYMEPAPYWEPSEESFIIHYTKTVVNGFGLESGWSEPVGLPVEIVPLTRPYGLWAGNIFTGRVLKEGKPLPGCEVEVEYFNVDGVKIPGNPFVTQVVLTDERGIFSYAMPRAGWWGFSALTEGAKKIEKDGSPKAVELGGVIWVRTLEMR